MRHSIEYKVGQYQLTVNIWFLIIFLLVQTGLNELGFWQLSRAHEKQARLEKLTNNDLPVMKNLDAIAQSFVDNFGNVQLQVELSKRINFLIENKIQNGKLGYHVLNLVKDIESGRLVLVNRGWIEGKAHRDELPLVKLPPTYWSVTAKVYPINQQVLSEAAELENHGKIIRLPVLDVHIIALLEKRFGIDIEPYILRLDEDVSETFDIDWAWISMSPEKHLGYALQWFGLSLAFLIISLFVLIKKRPLHEKYDK